MSLRGMVSALAGVLALASAQAKPLGAGFTLVQDGRPSASIVLAAEPSENARAAASELRAYVKRISEADLPILTDTQAVSGNLILIGASRLAAGLEGLQIPTGTTPELKEEGFVIETRSNLLVAAGNDSEPYFGTRYAVAELLHRLGVRWFVPGAFGEIVPQQRSLIIPELHLRERPDFRMRNYWEHHQGNMAAEDIQWKIHHKMNPRIHEWFGVPGDSSIRGYLPGKEEFRAHPDWFAMRRDGSRDGNMVCMTSPGMIAYFVARVKADARAGKSYSAFAPDDGMPRCYCARCQKLANGFDGYGADDRDPLAEASISNEWFNFVNTVLDAVNQEFPKHRIVTNGYANRDIPPELLSFNRNHNLVVMFANICACTLHSYDDPGCWQMQRQGQMLQHWGQLSDKVWLYDYNYTMLVGKFTLTPMVHRLRHNLPLLHQWGLLGFHDQDEADWSLTGIPTRLVRAALEWDTRTKVDQLLDDFFRQWFGPAAHPMATYYDALEEAFEHTRVHGHEDVVLSSIYSPKLMTTLQGEMERAERQASEEPVRTRVRLERLMFDQLTDYVSMEEAKRACRFERGADFARKLMKRQGELNAISPFFGYEPYATYGPDWEAKRLSALADKTDGTEGTLLAVLPENARAREDPFDDGRYERWQEPALPDTAWTTLLTTRGWENQGAQDPHGHAYRGLMWYRLHVDLPEIGSDKKVWLCAPAVVNEAWVWVNGGYAGHRPHQMPWSRPHTLELEVTPLIKPGQANQITLRVLNNVDVFGASGIYERMFVYTKP